MPTPGLKFPNADPVSLPQFPIQLLWIVPQEKSDPTQEENSVLPSLLPLFHLNKFATLGAPSPRPRSTCNLGAFQAEEAATSVPPPLPRTPLLRPWGPITVEAPGPLLRPGLPRAEPEVCAESPPFPWGWGQPPGRACPSKEARPGDTRDDWL